MNKPRTFLCKNAEDNCPHYRDSTLITVGDTEKFVCPKGKVNCESDYLELVAPPDGPMTKLLKRVAVIAIPVVFSLLVWVYFATRPHPPFSVDVSYTSPPGGRIHPGDLISWTFYIKGGRPSDDPLVSFDSRSPSLLSNTEIKLETTDVFSRKYKLTGRANGQTGRGEVTVSVALGSNPKVTTNLPFEIVLLGPPTLALKSSPPLVLDAAHDSFILSFAVSDE